MKIKTLYRIIPLIMAALILITTSGCTAIKNPENQISDAGGESAIPEETHNERGNTTGNISNGGFAAIQGDWIYYVNSQYSYGNLYKIRTDGTEETKLNDDYCNYINVIGNWVYYRSDDDDGAICKIRTDGTERAVLNASDCKYITVIGNWIYYRNCSDGDKIYKIKTDGTEETKLGDMECGCLAVGDGRLYYSNESDGGKIYKISTDGSGNVCLSTHSGGSLNLVNNNIYFCDMFGTLYCVGTNGTGETDLCNIFSSYYSLEVKSFASINISGDTIYYCEMLLVYYKLCMIPLNVQSGTEETTYDMDCTGDINIVDDWIYFRGSTGAYRIHLDGTGKEKIK